MKHIILPGLALALSVGLPAGSASANTEFIKDTLYDNCSDASRQAVSDEARDNIEEHVARSEAAIRAPASVMDLSCITDLLDADLDVFSSTLDSGFLGGFDINGIINDITGGLKSGLSLETVSDGVQKAVCDFAQSKFGEVTSPISGGMSDILSHATDVMPSFSDGFDLMNLGSYNDTSTATSATGSVGAFSDSASYDTTALTSILEGMTSDELQTVINEAQAAITGSITGATAASTSGAQAASSSTTDAQIQGIWNSISGGN